MGENLALVEKILSKNEIEVYTLDTKETITLKVENYEVEELKELLEIEEMIIIGYDRENKTIDRSIKEFWKNRPWCFYSKTSWAIFISIVKEKLLIKIKSIF